MAYNFFHLGDTGSTVITTVSVVGGITLFVTVLNLGVTCIWFCWWKQQRSSFANSKLRKKGIIHTLSHTPTLSPHTHTHNTTTLIPPLTQLRNKRTFGSVTHTRTMLFTHLTMLLHN